MIVFILSMPNRNTWNGKWSGDSLVFARTRRNNQVPKEYVGKEFYHHWDDGWTACVKVEKMDAKDANKLMKKSCGFCGYDWMIDSIIRNGEIRYKRDLA